MGGQATQTVVPTHSIPDRYFELYQPDLLVPHPVLYLALSRELIEVGRPDLATFCFLHAGDVREVEREATMSAQGALFDTTLEQFDAFLTRGAILSRQRHPRMHSTCIPHKLHTPTLAWKATLNHTGLYTAYLWHQLGLLSESLGLLERAAAYLQEAVNLNPYGPIAHFYFARALLSTGDPVLEEQECRPSVDLGIALPQGHVLLAEVV